MNLIPPYVVSVSETTDVGLLEGTGVEQRVVGQLIRFDHRAV